MDEFAIIGTREPDLAQKLAARELAHRLSELNCLIRTGGADGIDTDAMIGTLKGHLRVYLPWASYNKAVIPEHAEIVVYNPRSNGDWTRSVNLFHPAPNALSRGAFALHARNFGIVSGARGVIAMPDRLGGGGTGQGIRIAKALNIPLIQANKGSIGDYVCFVEAAIRSWRV
jgi:hypothetical protein